MNRIYTKIIQEHLDQFRQMVFLSGPRQAGKTTLSKASVASHSFQYVNWDNVKHRELILSGLNKVQTDIISDKNKTSVIILDEIHKYKHWKSLLKGCFDVMGDSYKFLITGSAKLNVFRRGGDSMMGRYFLYRIHPLSVAEILGRTNVEREIVSPQEMTSEAWNNLLNFGGFPEPYLNANQRFYQR